MTAMNKKGNSMKVFLSLLVAGVITGGSFFAVSGMAVADSNVLVANVLSSFSGRPTVIIARSAKSPTGSLVNDTSQILAVFDVKAMNVKWQATLNSFTVSIPVSGRQAPSLSVTDFALHYAYCVNEGVTYGYGYKGGACGMMQSLEPTSVSFINGDTYVLVFKKDLPIYLTQTTGTITIVGKPSYTRAGMQAVQLKASITSGSAVGDQCKTIRYGYKNKYGYSKCGNQIGAVNVGSAKGNLLTVKRPPGYGYPPTPPVTPPVKPKTGDKR
ncbi:hypothetical protein EPO14_02975 [Patescibacteria group bacterium]|nr:MAG: hypothetical protein EPO14_02975 [Patescibacteria group bacterium]